MDVLIYNLVLHGVAAPFLAAYYLPSILLGRKYRRSLGGKLGRLPSDFSPKDLPRPRLWFHAVSVGEVVALNPLVKEMRKILPHAGFIVSTGTETGQDKARELIPEADGFLYLPLDFPAFVNRVVDAVDPDLFVLMETELWPNLIHRLKYRGTAIALANGRISDRSFPRYRRLRSFFASTLADIDLFLMSSDVDAERVRVMGAPETKIRVTGNTKFDAAFSNRPLQDGADGIRDLLGFKGDEPILVAGSTHPGENEIVLEVYERLLPMFPDLVLVIVPRHVEKTSQIVSVMKQRGMEPPFLRSSADRGGRRNGRKVVIVDRTGELFRVFSFASVVFMGGSLVPKGGQNVLEPAAWGKPILFGPSMEDFREARDILVRVGAGVEVMRADDLAAGMARFLSDPENAIRLGKNGRDEVLKHLGSSARNAEMLAELLAET